MSSLRSSMWTGTFYSLTALVLVRVITFVNSVAVTRLLGGENLGILSIQSSILAVVAILATFGIPAAAVKFVAEKGLENPKSVGEILSSGLLVTAFAASTAFVVIVVLAPYLANATFAEGRLVNLLVVGAIGLLIASIPGPAFALFQGLKRFRDMNVQSVLVATASVPVTIGLVYLYGLQGAAYAAAGIALTSLVINFRLFRRIQRQLHLHWQPPRLALSWRMLKYGTGTVLAGLVATPALLFGYALLARAYSFQTLGHYAVAFAIAGYLAFIPTSVGVPFIPNVSELSIRSPESVSSLLVKTIRVVSCVALPLSLVMILFSRLIVFTLYGAEFLPSSNLLPLTAAAAYFISVTSIVGFAIAGTGKIWHGLGLNALWGGFYSGVAWVLVPAYGSFGLAATLLISYVLHTATVLTYSKWAFGLPLRKLFAPTFVAMVALPAAIVSTTSAIGSIMWIVIPCLVSVVLMAEWIFLWPSERDLVRSAFRKGARLLAAVIRR